MRVLNTAQMREADRRTIADLGVPSLVLMEQAGRQVVSLLESHWPPGPDRRIAVVCGKGNNGGDGFVAARILAGHGAAVRVYLAAPAADIGETPASICRRSGDPGVPVVDISDPLAWAAARTDLGGCDVVVDALFGTGLTRPLGGEWRSIVADLDALDPPVVSIDLPSGLSADTAKPIGESVAAGLTVTLGAPKLPLLLDPRGAPGRQGRRRRHRHSRRRRGRHRGAAGDGRYPGVGPGADSEPAAGHAQGRLRAGARRRRIDGQDRRGRPRRPRRPALGGGSGDGGDTARLPAGGRGSGAGVHDPRPSTHDAEGRVGAEAAEAVLAERCDVLAVGPGLGRSAGVARCVRELVDRAPVPLVLDADALNAFAGDPAGLRGRPDRPLVITPHAGEMGRLVGRPAAEVAAHRLDAARDLAAEQGIFVVLKGARTLVATPAGAVGINVTGNPGMATGGVGDVLTGVLAAWMAQLSDVEAACGLGVCLHGMAGDLAAAGQGAGLVAGDLARQLGPALLALARAEPDRHDQEPEFRPL